MKRRIEYDIDDIVSCFREDADRNFLGGDIVSLLPFWQKFLYSLDLILSKNISSKDSKLIDCKKGCYYCCIVNVSILEIEAYNISHFLYENNTDFNLKSLKNKLRFLSKDYYGLTDSERIISKRYCPFLNKEGACSIHSVRPLVCRAVTSTDVRDCKNSINSEVWGETIPILQNQIQRDIYDYAFIKIGEVHKTLGLESRSEEITQSVSKILTRTDKNF